MCPLSAYDGWPASRNRAAFPERPLNGTPEPTPVRQEAHRNDTGTGGRFVVMTQERDRQERRTRTARRTVVALGATGALGAAGAIGFGIASAQGTDATTPDSRSQEQDQPGQDLRGDDFGNQDLGD